MISVEYVADSKFNSDKYCSCDACGTRFEDDNKMVKVTFRRQNGFGMMIHLCDKCRRELYEKI